MEGEGEAAGPGVEAPRSGIPDTLNGPGRLNGGGTGGDILWGRWQQRGRVRRRRVRQLGRGGGVTAFLTLSLSSGGQQAVGHRTSETCVQTVFYQWLNYHTSPVQAKFFVLSFCLYLLLRGQAVCSTWAPT